VNRLKRHLAILESKARFIRLVIEEKLKVKNRKRDDVINDLRKQDFRTIEEITQDVEDEEEDQGEDNELKVTRGSHGFDYLLGMPIWNLTFEKVEDAERKMKEKAAELEKLQLTAVEEIWEADLNAILYELDLMEVEDTALGKDADKTKMRARSAELRAAAEAKKKKFRTMLSGGAVSVAPTPSHSNDWLLALQERQLAKTRAAFPGLFNDVLGKPLPSPAKRPGGKIDEAVAAKRTKTDLLSPGSSSKAKNDSSQSI